MKRIASISLSCVVLLLCLSLNSSAIAAQVDMDETTIAAELKTLSRSIESLTKQMQQQAGGLQKDATLRKLDIAIAYLNFRSRRIEMFERDLQSARMNRNRLDDVMEQLQREEDGLAQSFDINQKEAVQRAREELSFRRETVKGRLSRMDEEIILLENRIAEMQSQIDSVESFVQKNLEF